MTAARVWLIVTVAAFLGWIGWLGYLAATATHPTVLSRPQFLVSTLDVTARVQVDGDGRIKTTATIEASLWSASGLAKPEKGQIITVENLHATQGYGWQGQGKYLLALQEVGNGQYRVAAIPPSPGFRGGEPRIYRLTDRNREEILEQYQSLGKKPNGNQNADPTP